MKQCAFVIMFMVLLTLTVPAGAESELPDLVVPDAGPLPVVQSAMKKGLPAGKRLTFFPEGDIFAAPLASIKEPRFHLTWFRLNLEGDKINVASVGFGENFGLVRWQGWREDQFWQFGISGAVQSQFNLDSTSMDLVNADYIIGFPLTVRSKAWSGRLRLYHQSSHLGDEYVLYPQEGVPVVDRINLSYEAVEAWVGYDWEQWRIFAGPSLILHTDTPLKRKSVQVGVDCRGGVDSDAVRPFGALFVNWWEEVDWVAAVSLRAGVILTSPYASRRQGRVYAEGFKGHLPFGQFYQQNASYYGLGISFGF